MRQKIYGIIPPIVTPFSAEGAIDEPALKEVLQYEAAFGSGAGCLTLSKEGGGHAATRTEKGGPWARS